MRLLLLLPLLLLSSLVLQAQGIRLIRKEYSISDKQHNIHEILLGEKNNDEFEDVILRKDKHLSGSIRKLTTTPSIATTTTIPKNDKNEENKAHPLSKSSSTNEKLHRKEEDMSVNSSSKSEVQEPYPDLLDVAGMDYSLARRKSPIHN
ncbi:hypothetical protein ACJIZ3_025310 [Penstemon smallii]|uniref:Uncharacterized protein n=1 Tax=Penstemon smallii TaxID=265156 RepID=A0ABD3TU83_9LAMI